MSIQTWRYYLPESQELRDSWSIVFVDSTGCVAVLSDYGDWCYRWVTKYTGARDFRDFLVGVGPDYAASKLSSGRPDRHVFDGDATRDAVRRRIIELRRSGGIDRDLAREEWERSYSIVDGEFEFGHFIHETELDDMYELGSYTMASGLKHWITVSLPRLQKMIQAQLDAERGSAEIAGLV